MKLRRALLKLLQNNWIAAGALCVLILATYLPFCLEPVLRPTGDDKVYLSQVLEMIGGDNWFLQRLNGEPNYYKGPLLYLLLQGSMRLFSPYSTLATLLPNIVTLVAGALATFLFVRKERRGDDQASLAAFLTAAGFALSFGIYPFLFAAQMEVLLTAAYTFVTILIVNSLRTGLFWPTWAWIGAIGWIKSPVHSALCGVAFFAACILSRNASYFRSTKFWISAAIGVAVGVAGYLPQLLLDYDNFWVTYVMRETATKGPNGVSVVSSVMPFLTYFLVPFGFFLIAGSFRGIAGLRAAGEPITKIYSAEISLIAINAAFFAWHPYRSEIYCLPLTAVIFIAIGRTCRLDTADGITGAWKLSAAVLHSVGWFALAFFAITIAGVGASVVAGGLGHDHEISSFTASFAIGSTAFLVALVAITRQRPWAARLPLVVVGSLPLYLSLGFLMRDLARWDLRDLKIVAASSAEFGYWNEDRRIWSEWGAMNAWLARPVQNYHNATQLLNALRTGAVVYAPHAEALASVKKMFTDHELPCCLVIRPVTRFRVAGGGRGIDWYAVFVQKDWSHVLVESYAVSYSPQATLGVRLIQ